MADPKEGAFSPQRDTASRQQEKCQPEWCHQSSCAGSPRLSRGTSVCLSLDVCEQKAESEATSVHWHHFFCIQPTPGHVCPWSHTCPWPLICLRSSVYGSTSVHNPTSVHGPTSLHGPMSVHSPPSAYGPLSTVPHLSMVPHPSTAPCLSMVSRLSTAPHPCTAP